MTNKNLTSDKGSIWRKWDLHLHTPNTKLSDGFVKIGEEEIWKTYCDKKGRLHLGFTPEGAAILENVFDQTAKWRKD